MADHKQFTGRSAIVTGATRGIGRAIALELARRGSDVAFNYAKSAAAAVAKEARTNVRRVVRIRCSIIVAGNSCKMRRVGGTLLPAFAVRGTAPATA